MVVLKKPQNLACEPFSHLTIQPFIIGTLSLLPQRAFAYRLTDSGWDCRGFLKCGSGTDVVTDMIGNIIAVVVLFIGALAVVMVIYGALRWVTSRGEEGKEAGKKAMLYAALGLVFALLTGAILEFITDYLYLIGGT